MSNVQTVHPSYADMLPRWELMDALYGGEHEVHEAAETYLPRLHEEDDRAYAARLAMTPLFNATYRTISGMRGMVFRKPPVIEVPPAITDMTTDIDLAGTSLVALLQKITDASLTFGRYGLLVDYPETNAGATKADAKALNYRPMVVLYGAKAIYNWRTSRVNGATVLSRAQLEEDDETLDPENEFKTKSEKRYRVLDLDDAGFYRQRVFKKAKGGIGEPVQDGEDVYPTMNGAKLTYIPFYIGGADCIGPDVEAPPLIDLGTTNIHHYMQASSYERGCFFSGLPTMFVSGCDPDETEIAIGGAIANILPRPDSKAWYVEISGDFVALRNNLEDKKKEMAVLGARMLEQQQKQVESGSSAALRHGGEESLLAAMSATISTVVTQALEVFAEWAGATGDVSVKLNKDFLPGDMPMSDLVALVSAWQSGAISEEAKFDYLKRKEFYVGDLTFEEEQARIGNAQMQFATGQEPLPAEPTTAPLEATPAEPFDTSAIDAAIATLTEQHQAMFEQLLQSIEALKKPEPAVVPVQQEPDADMKGMMQAMGDQHAASMAAIANALGKEQPAPIVNVAAQPAPIVNISPAAVNVAAPIINMPEQPITINMPEQQPAPLTVNTGQGAKTISVQRDASGKITGASVAET